MAEYHVGCGIMGIYAGTLNKNKTTWINKSQVTNEACCAVAQWMLENGKGMKFEHDGKKYVLKVEEAEE